MTRDRLAHVLRTEERQGRHCYVRLASADVATLIENLAAMAPPRQTAPRSLAVASRNQALPGLAPAMTTWRARLVSRSPTPCTSEAC